ncbi:hypothetical protein ELZ88_24620 (plasmid) [Salmonella enterica subsp. enterica serovar Karamoja]|uniref:Uncharacterized protein n=1 Tax=Salmonella enterica subsp. enterica serovar Karamoja TaxID=2500153 RepID=A0A3Q9MXI2_SALET|nr:hypothetical protein [Salmonella enterica]AZT39710.1 hypothetical protein ELZ88_24620 [Salmonella enterica subsp. enterica serovar Karamoja]AZT44387.1 hypothetical protein EL007_24325 [Salmonella enterica subsp. enterica serovar Karamoja]
MRVNLSQNKKSWLLLSDIIALICLLTGIGSFSWVLSHPPAEEALLLAMMVFLLYLILFIRDLIQARASAG